MNMKRNDRPKRPRMDMYGHMSLESAMSKSDNKPSFEKEIFREDISKNTNYPKTLRRPQGRRYLNRASSSRELLLDNESIKKVYRRPTPKWEPKKSSIKKNSGRRTTERPKKQPENPFVMNVSEKEIIYKDITPKDIEDPRLKAFEFKEKSDLREDLYVGKDGNLYINEEGSHKNNDVMLDSNPEIGYDMYGMDKHFHQEQSQPTTRTIDMSDEENLLLNHREFSTRKSRVTTMEDLLNLSDKSTTRETAHKRPPTGRPAKSSSVYLGEKYTRPTTKVVKIKRRRKNESDASNGSKKYRTFEFKD